MTVRSQPLLYLIPVAIAATLAACGGSSSVSAPEMPAPGSSATIAGTVVSAVAGVGSGGDVSSRAASGGLRVSVVGTPLETTTDDEGRFTLTGVTPGEKVELRFEGPGIDARLEIGGLVAGQTLTVTVRVSGSTVSMVSSDDDDGEMELRGFVESTGVSSLIVSGRTVTVDEMTEILGRQNQPIALSDIATGAFVEVEGWMQADGSVLAKKVKLEDDDDEDEDDEGEDDDDDDDDDDEDDED